MPLCKSRGPARSGPQRRASTVLVSAGGAEGERRGRSTSAASPATGQPPPARPPTPGAARGPQLPSYVLSVRLRPDLIPPSSPLTPRRRPEIWRPSVTIATAHHPGTPAASGLSMRLRRRGPDSPPSRDAPDHKSAGWCSHLVATYEQGIPGFRDHRGPDKESPVNHCTAVLLGLIEAPGRPADAS